MEKRNEIKSIFKSNDPEELLVFKAASLKNEIRLYLNDTIYLAAIETEEGCKIGLGEEEECKTHKKMTKKKFKKFIKIFSINLGIVILGLAGLFYLCNHINNIFLFLIIMNIMPFIIVIANVVIMEAIETSPALRSKHSAEHMMVNFLQINKRLPKNIEEVKKSSRFSPECGSRELIKGIAEDFVRSIIATIFTAITYVIISHFSSNYVIIFIWLLSTNYSLRFIVGKLITKYGVLNFAIKPLNKVLTNIIQCVNTTANVKDKDIAMAYCVSKAWLQIVYPEFYNGNDDSWNKYLKLIKSNYC